MKVSKGDDHDVTTAGVCGGEKDEEEGERIIEKLKVKRQKLEQGVCCMCA